MNNVENNNHNNNNDNNSNNNSINNDNDCNVNNLNQLIVFRSEKKLEGSVLTFLIPGNGILILTAFLRVVALELSTRSWASNGKLGNIGLLTSLGVLWLSDVTTEITSKLALFVGMYITDNHVITRDHSLGNFISDKVDNRFCFYDDLDVELIIKLETESSSIRCDVRPIPSLSALKGVAEHGE
ncbi:unnamed protein product [Schistosoma margrebowiei]|uniref:Uncharacterized protein n=1 Tax=Schistosoma margrebowiei TaxID=48269 RepID=A0A183NCC5_9TREM|nr:unnamed protein product [Schistosoma margrebowiei]